LKPLVAKFRRLLTSNGMSLAIGVLIFEHQLQETFALKKALITVKEFIDIFNS
jgi:hypothetical protein